MNNIPLPPAPAAAPQVEVTELSQKLQAAGVALASATMIPAEINKIQSDLVEIRNMLAKFGMIYPGTDTTKEVQEVVHLEALLATKGASTSVSPIVASLPSSPSSATGQPTPSPVNTGTPVVTNPATAQPVATPPPPPPTRIIGLVGDMTFGYTRNGQPVTRVLTVTNAGTAPLMVQTVICPTGFSANWTSGTVAPGGSQSVNVTFLPSKSMTYVGTINVTGDQTSGTNTVAISGTGIPWYISGKRLALSVAAILLVLCLGLWFFLKPKTPAVTRQDPPVVATDTNVVATINALKQELVAMHETLRRATNQVHAATPSNSVAFARVETNNAESTKTPERKNTYIELSEAKQMDKRHDEYVTEEAILGANELVIIVAPRKGWRANYWVSDPEMVENRQEGQPVEFGQSGTKRAESTYKRNATLSLKPGGIPVTYKVTFFRE